MSSQLQGNTAADSWFPRVERRLNRALVLCFQCTQQLRVLRARRRCSLVANLLSAFASQC